MNHNINLSTLKQQKINQARIVLYDTGQIWYVPSHFFKHFLNADLTFEMYSRMQ